MNENERTTNGDDDGQVNEREKDIHIVRLCSMKRQPPIHISFSCAILMDREKENKHSASSSTWLSWDAICCYVRRSQSGIIIHTHTMNWALFNFITRTKTIFFRCTAICAFIFDAVDDIVHSIQTHPNHFGITCKTANTQTHTHTHGTKEWMKQNVNSIQYTTDSSST